MSNVSFNFFEFGNGDFLRKEKAGSLLLPAHSLCVSFSGDHLREIRRRRGTRPHREIRHHEPRVPHGTHHHETHRARPAQRGIRVLLSRVQHSHALRSRRDSPRLGDHTSPEPSPDYRPMDDHASRSPSPSVPANPDHGTRVLHRRRALRQTSQDRNTRTARKRKDSSRNIHTCRPEPVRQQLRPDLRRSPPRLEPAPASKPSESPAPQSTPDTLCIS